MSEQVRAIAIDRSSPEWAEINAYHLEFRFGEPPCILHWHGSDFVLSDPPVCIGGSPGLPGEWVTVPTGHSSDFLAATTWARAHVGVAGDAPDGPRPLLVLDDPPPYLDGWTTMPLWYLHSRADNAQVMVRLELDEALGGEAAGGLARSLYDRLVGATVASVGESSTVTYGGDEAATGWGLLVGGVTSRGGDHVAVTSATESAWDEVVNRLRSGDLTAAQCSITRSDAFGRIWEPFSCMRASFSIWRDPGEDTDPRARLLEISVDLPYFQHIFRPADAEAVARSALASLPLRRGFVHVGRWPASTAHWIDIVATDEVVDAAPYAISETHGDLTWLQRASEPPSPAVEI